MLIGQPAGKATNNQRYLGHWYEKYVAHNGVPGNQKIHWIIGITGNMAALIDNLHLIMTRISQFGQSLHPQTQLRLPIYFSSFQPTRFAKTLVTNAPCANLG